MRGAKPSLSEDKDALTETPAPPDWLGEYAQEEWGRVAPVLVQRKILTVVDLGMLEAYCVAMGQVRHCEWQIQKFGMTQNLVSGERKRPAVQIQADAMNRARLLAAELGLTPVSRSRPSIKDDDDGADSFLGI